MMRAVKPTIHPHSELNRGDGEVVTSTSPPPGRYHQAQVVAFVDLPVTTVDHVLPSAENSISKL